MTERKVNVIFVIGAPGSGKGTQCKRIAKKSDYVHLSVGDLLREESNKSDSNIGKEIKNEMKNGSLASSEITCKLIENAMKKTNKQNFLIDGFPRNKDNINEWQKLSMIILIFNTSTDRCIERGKESGRSDDNEQSLKKRLITYKEETIPVIQFYEKENLVQSIDASNDVDKIFEDVEKVMNKFK